MCRYFSQEQRPQVRMSLDLANAFKPLVYIATVHHTSTTGPLVCGKKFLQIPWDLTYQAFVVDIRVDKSLCLGAAETQGCYIPGLHTFS